MLQTVDADVIEEVATPVGGLSSYYFSVDAVTTTEAASLAVVAAMTVDATTTAVASGSSS